MTTPRGFRDRSDDSLLTLIGDLPELVRNLVVAEVAAAKKWLGKTAKDGGIGALWVFLALFVLFWSVPALATFLIAGAYSLWGWPIWLGAIVTFGIGILIVAVFVLLGILRFRRLASRPNPAQTIVQDVKEVRDEL